jgi:hypothetical protein
MRKIVSIKTNGCLINKSTQITVLMIVALFISTISVSTATETQPFMDMLTKNSPFPNILQEKKNVRFNRGISWDVRLNLSKLGGITDFVYFGEAPDANDGPPADDYDTIKQPPPTTNYIYAWFNDSLPFPYNLLERDYRQYPSDSKIWNLSVLWVPTHGTPPATITIAWDRTLLNMSEYDQIFILNESGVQIANMKVNDSFTFICPANTLQLFTINCQMDSTIPQLSNLTLLNSDPKDTDTVFGWENITVDATDDVAVSQVRINITYPDMHTENLSMIAFDEEGYYYNTTLTSVGIYCYFIWVIDTTSVSNMSSLNSYTKPANWDVNMDGVCNLLDVALVSLKWLQGGPLGWIREDITNDGTVNIIDVSALSTYWMQTWL